MTIFVSHAINDKNLLKGIKEKLEPYGLKLLIAEHYIDFQKSITDKIRNMIEQSTVGLILLTFQGIDSGFVREEIGYMDAKMKPRLLVIEKGLESKYGGFMYGHDYISLDPDEPMKAFEQIKNALIKYWNDLMLFENNRLNNEKQEKFVALSILAGLLILGSK